MSLKVGIVGLPNVGKSTLFNALLKKQQALAANYPFATIEPNVGIVPVPDSRLEALAYVIASGESLTSGQGEKPLAEGIKLPPIVPATVEFVDIAGIVAGAHKGEGLGNQFLSHIREVDLIAHVVRDFADADVVQTGEDTNTDYQTIISELIFKDLDTVIKQQAKLQKDRSKEAAGLLAVANKLVSGFNQEKRAVELLSEDELALTKEWSLLTTKPQILVVNTSEDNLKTTAQVSNRVAELLQVPVAEIVVVSAKIESELSTLSQEDANIFMAELGIQQSGLERLIQTGYSRLGLMSFLTAGEKEVRAWTIGRQTTAVAAAGVIHTDFMAKFIKAEVVDFTHFIENGGWKKARELGKVRLEGRDYMMQDGDVVEFKIGG